MANTVGIQYDSATASMLVHINGKRVPLLSDQRESNLETYYPSTFLADSSITQESEVSNFKSTANPLPAKDFDPKQQDFDKFFHLGLEPINDMSIDSFCRNAKL